MCTLSIPGHPIDHLTRHAFMVRHKQRTLNTTPGSGTKAPRHESVNSFVTVPPRAFHIPSSLVVQDGLFLCRSTLPTIPRAHEHEQIPPYRYSTPCAAGCLGPSNWPCYRIGANPTPRPDCCSSCALTKARAHPAGAGTRMSRRARPALAASAAQAVRSELSALVPALLTPQRLAVWMSGFCCSL